MFKVRRKYRHISCLDVDIEVHGIIWDTELAYTMIIRYINRHYDCYISPQTTATIRKEDLYKWSEVK